MPDPSLPPTPDNGETPDQSRNAGRLSAHDAAQARREKFALRRLLRETSDGELELERKLRSLEATELDAKKTIESHSRAEHWGREPERPWAWRAAADGPEDPRR